ncbi:MAG: DUF3299 domain-containing protein [Gammaproteobacteria bacterium]|nr:DUF3299 domain-containing protein [Gammaproteobacteria bacterium]
MKSHKTIIQFISGMFTILLLIAGNDLLAAQAEQISWDDLMPEGWNPEKVFQDMSDEEFNALPEETYELMLKKVQAELDNAPVVDRLNDKQVKIPGFIVPLEINNTNISEFLLVPYFGACTHTPPPPANQIIYSKVKTQYTLDDIYQPVWISGTLKTGRVTSQLNEAGVPQAADIESAYSMQVDTIEPYEE